MLNGKDSLYAKPKFQKQNKKLIDSSEIKKVKYNHLKVTKVIKTNNSEKYYQLATQTNGGVFNNAWVKSNGIENTPVTIHNSKQATQKVTDQFIPKEHRKDWRSQVNLGKNQDSYVVEVTDPAQTKKSRKRGSCRLLYCLQQWYRKRTIDNYLTIYQVFKDIH